jgi:dTDP-4-dehydrorhamnose reductase
MQLLEKENPQHTYYNTDVQELDITDQQAVEQFVTGNQIDGIVNCAAYTAVDKAEDNKEFCATLNSVAPAYLAAAVEKRGGHGARGGRFHARYAHQRRSGAGHAAGL